MRHPSNLYLLAKSCYECHLVDDAELVNQSSHPAVSDRFNMVSWSQGSMRHNYLRTNGVGNELSSPARLRVMFVTDILTRTQYLLKALVDSQPGSRHQAIMQSELLAATEKIGTISKAVANQWIDEAAKAVRSLDDQSTAKDRKKVAEFLGKLAFDFADKEILHSLEAIQPMLPSQDSYR